MTNLYIIKNTINGKCYIGQTTSSLKRRTCNGKGYIGNMYFYKDIQKYGWEYFTKNIICQCENYEADILERAFIKKYDSIESGYNLQSGGKANFKNNASSNKKSSLSQKGRKNPLLSILNKNRIWTQEQRNKISAVHKNKKKSEETKHKMSIAQTGSKNGMYGKKVECRCRKCICIELNKVFDSIGDGAKYTKCQRSKISAVCLKKRNTTGGYHWEYI